MTTLGCQHGTYFTGSVPSGSKQSGGFPQDAEDLKVDLNNLERKLCVKKVTAIPGWGVFLGALICPLTSNALVIENSAGTYNVQVNYFELLGQSFTAEFADLTSIAFYFSTINPGYGNNDPFRMFLYEGAGYGGTQLGSVSFSLPDPPSTGTIYGYYDADFSSIDLVVGSVYTAAVITEGNSALWGLTWGGNSYAGGQSYSDSVNANLFCGNGAKCDLNFRVIGEAVPTTATLPLLGLGLTALGYSRRKRKP
jgi:hypothetical protein